MNDRQIRLTRQIVLTEDNPACPLVCLVVAAMARLDAPVQQLHEVALRIGDERHPHPCLRRRARRHDRSRSAGDGTVVPCVEVSHVECDVPVPLAQRGLRRSPRFAVCRRTRPVQQLEPVAVGRMDEHRDAQVDRVDPERELRHQPEDVAEPRGGGLEVGDRQPDVVQPAATAPWSAMDVQPGRVRRQVRRETARRVAHRADLAETAVRAV